MKLNSILYKITAKIVKVVQNVIVHMFLLDIAYSAGHGQGALGL